MEATTQMETVIMLSGLKKHIETHAQREKDRGGYEAVGFIAGKGKAITTAVELHNHSSDPNNTFFVEPWEIWKNERALEEAGFTVRGVYHSHPTSEARPSRGDTSQARPKEIMIIYSVAFEELEAWREKDGSLEPVELVFVDNYLEVEEDDI
jgi:proteasome lid subunit RPN8/RPN11